MTTDNKFMKLAQEIGTLVAEKNTAYGNSFDQCGEFLRLLYPNGISPEKYGDMLCVVRIFDKLKRIATKKDAFSESPYKDLMGYALLGLERDERIKDNLEKIECALEQTISTEMKPAEPVATETVIVSCSICGNQIEQPVPKAYVDEGKTFMHVPCYEKQKQQEEESKARETRDLGPAIRDVEQSD